MARVITVTSGKGGVGKTNISANLALCLARQGYRTCLFDADLGLANINILLGLYPEHDLGDVILNEKTIDDIIIKDYKGIDIIPGSSGVEKMADLDPEKLEYMIRSFSELDGEYDFFIFDTSAGVSKNVISFCMASSEVILIVTPEPTSLTDGYALLKILSLNGFNNSVMVAVNQCKNIQSARIVYTKFRETVEKFLPVKVLPLGAVMQDSNVVKAVKEQKPFVSRYPNSTASICIKKMAKHLGEEKAADTEIYGLETFWTRCLRVFKEPVQLTGTKAVKKPEESKHDVPDEKATIDQHSAEKKASLSGAVEISSSSDPSSHPQIIEGGHMAQEIRLLLEDLVKNVSSMSQDIGVIRKALGNGRGEHPETKLPPEDTVNSEATIIPLDFEAFLKRCEHR
ncbi:MAG: MinD/ParA family protein [Deltaproteobacteria bacterium]|nr:MinD/ParA family protein [Deltaproteobacteria bacterium]MBW2144665.1 MinD/ParA family protein [Deltaproteobacteria bacterium]